MDCPKCIRLCPWNLALRVLADHYGIDEHAPLFPDKDGKLVPKIKIIKAWMEHIDPEITGHSGRRSGAMWYARRGLPVHEIGLLGRWKSSAVFRYIEEALQEIPLNAGAHKVESLEGTWAAPSTPASTFPIEVDKDRDSPSSKHTQDKSRQRQTSWTRSVLGSFKWQERTGVSPHPQGVLERQPGSLGHLVWLAFCREKRESHDHAQISARNKQMQKV